MTSGPTVASCDPGQPTASWLELKPTLRREHVPSITSLVKSLWLGSGEGGAQAPRRIYYNVLLMYVEFNCLLHSYVCTQRLLPLEAREASFCSGRWSKQTLVTCLLLRIKTYRMPGPDGTFTSPIPRPENSSWNGRCKDCGSRRRGRATTG